MFHIGIEAAQLALAFRPASAQSGDGTRLDDLEKVEPCRGADILAFFGVESFEVRLRRCDICAGLGEVAIAAGQLERRRAGGWRSEQRQCECGRHDQADERDKCE
jgi:hypothetical protein